MDGYVASPSARHDDQVDQTITRSQAIDEEVCPAVRYRPGLLRPSTCLEAYFDVGSTCAGASSTLPSATTSFRPTYPSYQTLTSTEVPKEAFHALEPV